MKKQRIFYYDVARFIAILSITCNHALSRSFEYHAAPLEEFNSIPMGYSVFKAFMCIFSRVGVPLFLMITGALLLNRDYEDKNKLRRFIKHNYLGMLITTEIWLFILFWFKQFTDSMILENRGFLSAAFACLKTMLFVNQVTVPSMWYMPMILCVYLLIPVISAALKKIDHKYIIGLCAFILFSSMIIPNINVVFGALGKDQNIDFALSPQFLFSHYLVYMLAGYFISNDILKKINTKLIAAGFILSFAGTAAFQMFMFSADYEYYVRYADIGIVLCAAFLFELVKRKADKAKVFSRQITFVSKAAFGIYFLHICFMNVMNIILADVPEIQYISKFFILEIISVVLSLVIIYFTSKIGFIKKYFYMMKD